MKIKKRFRRFAAVLIAVILLCALFEQLEYSFKANNFPINQSDTVWRSDDGLLTVSVSDEAAIKKSDRIQRYHYEATILWNGEQYSVSFGFDSTGYFPLIRDGRSPHHVDLCLEDSAGVTIETVSCKYHMPNKHTLKLSPIDPQADIFPTDTITLSRIDPE